MILTSLISLLRWPLFLALLAFAFAAGFGAAFLENLVTVALMYPAALGIVVGIPMAFWVQLAFVPHPRLVLALAGGLAIGAIMGLHVGRYQVFVTEYGVLARDAALEGMMLPGDADYIADVSQAVPTDAEIAAERQQFLIEETGYDGISGFLRLELNSPIRTLPAGGLDVPSPWVAVFWGVEWIVVAWIVATFGTRLARFPRCAQCDNWLVQHEVGIASEATASQWKNAMTQGNVVQLLDLVTQDKLTHRRPSSPAARLFRLQCPECSEQDVTFQLVGKKGELLANLTLNVHG